MEGILRTRQFGSMFRTFAIGRAPLFEGTVYESVIERGVRPSDSDLPTAGAQHVEDSPGTHDALRCRPCLGACDESLTPWSLHRHPSPIFTGGDVMQHVRGQEFGFGPFQQGYGRHFIALHARDARTG